MPDASHDSLAIVTGTSTGIGEAVARQLLERGWDVIGIARRPSPISHGSYRHVAFDLATVARDPAPLEAALATHAGSAAPQRVGLVNNAAAPEGLVPLANLDPRQLARVYAVNVVAPLWLMGFAVRTLPTDAALRIVNVSSGAATNGFPGLAAYGSSKAALRLAGMSLAREWDTATPSKVLRDAAILSYEPGVVDTDMQRYARSRSPEEFPWVQMFLDFARRGIAVPPERPAHDIVAFLESNHQPHFAERRLST
jgi:NAD(P)-dependent dehydrogenase (short-subunit alcohol dehydrogenase family)